MRLRRLFCDVLLKVGQESFIAHRVVLAANSPYFSAMFANKEQGGGAFFTETDKSEIDLREVDASGARAVIDYFYTASIELNNLNFEAVFATANIWQVDFVLKTCERFLERELSISNCLGIQVLVNANLTFTDKLRNLIDNFVNAHFMEICEEVELLTIPKEHLKMLLLKDELCVSSEEILFEIALRWLKHDINKRRCYATELISAVRLGLLGKKFIQNAVLKEKNILDDSDLKHLFDNILQYLKGDQNIQISDYLTRKRKCQVLYVCGGFSSSSNRLCQATAVDSVQFLSVCHEKWEVFSEAALPEAKTIFFKFVVGDGYLFAVGLKVLSFCLKRFVWEELYAESGGVKSLDIKNAGLCFSNGHIYAIGGALHAKKFSPSSRTWYDIHSNVVPEDHYRPGVCVQDGVVYVMGGCDSSYNDGKVVVESYLVLDNVWTVRLSMPTARWGLEAVPLNGKIFAIGGMLTTLISQHYKLCFVSLFGL
jgi:hypothetical protein